MIPTLLLIAVVILLTLVAIGKIPLSYNLRNLSIRWKTTLMTSLAFTAVIGLLTVMMAFVGGMQQLTEKTGQPGNVVVMADGATDEVISNISGSDVAEMESLPEVVRRNGRPMASRETYLVVNQPPAAKSDGRQRQRFLQLRGIEDPQLAATVHGLALLSGSWFSEAGVQSASAAGGSAAAAPLVQAVLGEGIAHELGRSRSRQELATAKNRERLDLGDTFRVGNRQWVVVGVLKSVGLTFNSEIWAKRSLVAALFGKDTYTSLVLRSKDAEGAQKLKSFLAHDYKKAAVEAQVETEYYATLSQTTAQFSYAIAFLATVMSVGGIFGVMNTMFAAISQRVKDIGVLRLLGYARWHILVSFLLESMVIALVGGLVGCGLGCLTDGWTASSMVASQSGGKSVVVQLAVSTNIISTGILLTLLMGLLGGLLPALSAMRMKPLEALR
jgi:ABC-type antimicrobial peptide transport system permease subunit